MRATADRHGPNRFKTYREIHETVLQQFMSRDFVKSDTLAFKAYHRKIFLRGEIGCLGEIVISVTKCLDILEGVGDNASIQTRWYSYDVLVRGHGNIFRYDNQDPGFLRPGHLDDHHKHLFDWRIADPDEGELSDSPRWIGCQNWPTLGDVLQETQDWYWHHRSELPNPDDYPALDVRGH